jgi:hypothetical protein
VPGPYVPNPRLGADGPPFFEPHPSQPIPGQPPHAMRPVGEAVEAASPSVAYPGPLPPPVSHPKRRGRRVFLGIVLALVVITGLVVAILHGSHSVAPTATISDATAKTAIQSYLDALKQRDTETIARNSLCGIYDAVRDRRSDQALAKLSSDAFRKQFSEAQVTSIDKIVYWSDYQAQVLFSMRVKPGGGGASREQVQGLAQLLVQHNQVLVCSYVLRTAGSY